MQQIYDGDRLDRSGFLAGIGTGARKREERMGEHPRIGAGRGTLAAIFCVVVVAILLFLNRIDGTGETTAVATLGADETAEPVELAEETAADVPSGPVAEPAPEEEASGQVATLEPLDEPATAEEAASTVTDSGEADEPQDEITSGPDGETVADEPASAPAPGFDVVRVDPTGSAVVAGTAAPNAMVTIGDGTNALAEVEADGAGNFVAVFEAGPSTAPRALTLNAVTPDGSTSVSDDVVVLLPEGSEDVAVAAVDPEELSPTEDTASDAGGEIAATAIIRDGGVEVISNEPLENVSQAQVKLSSISYSEAGEVTLAGLGLAGSALRVYVDATLAGEGRVGEDGRWVMVLSDVAEGLYVLRVDQLDENGSVISRIETPFKREFPEIAVGPGGSSGLVGTGGAPVSVTVQPGGNLWTLARIHYGSGVLYTQIFTANSDLIRDPDLIFPGQVLAIPGLEEAQ